MLSPLLVFALDLNQSVTDRIFRYRAPIKWWSSQQQWFEESGWLKLVAWRIINYGFLLFILLPSCVFAVPHALYYPGKHNLLNVVCIFPQLL